MCRCVAIKTRTLLIRGDIVMPDEYTSLPGSRRFNRVGAEILGRADSHEWCEVTVKLRRKTPLPEPSPTGQPVVTQRQLAEDHGANPDDAAKVERVFTALGLTVVDRNEAACTIRFGGPVDVMERAFALHLFRA